MDLLLNLLPNQRISIAIAFAAVVHVTLIGSIAFTKSPPKPTPKVLQVTVATQKHDATPKDADFLAQANQIGSGNLEKKAELATTELSDFHADRINDLQKQAQITTPKETQEARNRVLTSKINAHAKTKENQPKPPSELKPHTPEESALIAKRSQEIASLEAQLEERRQAFAKRPRRRQLTAVSTKASADAAYMDAWRRKIELVGNLNFPRLGSYGTLTLLVSLRADGSVEQTQIRRSSGNPSLDQAAVRIVRKASPFDPFPDEIKRHTDILEIIRTWKVEGGRITSPSQ